MSVMLLVAINTVVLLNGAQVDYKLTQWTTWLRQISLFLDLFTISYVIVCKHRKYCLISKAVQDTHGQWAKILGESKPQVSGRKQVRADGAPSNWCVASGSEFRVQATPGFQNTLERSALRTPRFLGERCRTSSWDTCFLSWGRTSSAQSRAGLLCQSRQMRSWILPHSTCLCLCCVMLIVKRRFLSLSLCSHLQLILLLQCQRAPYRHPSENKNNELTCVPTRTLRILQKFWLLKCILLKPLN